MRGLLPEPVRRPFLRGIAAALAILCFFAGGMAAWADPEPFARSFDIVPVKLAAAQSRGIALEGARSLPPGSLHAAIALDFNLHVLSLKLGDEKLGNLLPYRLDAHALFAYQLNRRLELALDLPFTVLQGNQFGLLGEALNAPDFPGAAGVSRVGMGDVRLLPRVSLLDPETFPVGLALVGEVRLPTGNGGSFMGERSVLVAPRLAVERAFGPVLLLGNLGWRFRKATQYLNLYVDDELTLGAGAVVDLPNMGRFTDVQVMGEMHLSTPASAPFNFRQADSLKTPWEVLAGVRTRVAGPWGIALNVGRGMGLRGGYGREDFRITFAVSYDRSGFEPDSDGDGVPDTVDKCPTEKEDRDGYQDDDGCLDADNDGDGISDGEDRCPNKPGKVEHRGCPEDQDTDGDGIPDVLDACPDKPGPKEYDGCPDSDGDEVPDNVDDCPELSGPPENNGCPYDSPPFVLVESDRIRIKGNILFETGQAKIQKQSFKLLDEVATVLRRNPTLGPVLIEGHTDNVGSRNYNVDLSQRRAKAVLDYLVSKGIDRKRLSSKGFGFDQPIATNDTPLGRAKNRRVEFRLVKSEVETAPREIQVPAAPAPSPAPAAPAPAPSAPSPAPAAPKP